MFLYQSVCSEKAVLALEEQHAPMRTGKLYPLPQHKIFFVLNGAMFPVFLSVELMWLNTTFCFLGFVFN